MILARNIETALWNKAIKTLLANGWTLTFQYDGFDAGIDYNCYTVERTGEKITFEWTNWEEGEIRCAAANLKEIEKLLGYQFLTIESVSDAGPGTPGNRP